MVIVIVIFIIVYSSFFTWLYFDKNLTSDKFYKNKTYTLVFKKRITNFFQIILLILFSKNSFSQNGLAADSMLVEVSELIYSKPVLVEKFAIMVSENESDPKKKIEFSFILSQIEYQKTNYQSALEYLYSIDNLIKDLDEKDIWNIRLNFNLAKIYRDLQIFDLADNYFHKANRLFKNFNKPNQKLTEIYNYENAIHRSQNGDYQGSNLILQKNFNANDNFRYLSFLGVGRNYIQTHQPDSAIIYFSKTPAEAEILYTSSLLGLAESSLQKNDWNSAKKYLINSLNRTSTLQTQKEIYNILSQIYLKEKNIERHESYKLNYDSVDNKISINVDQARNFVIKHIELEKYDDENDGNSFLTESIFFIICLIIIATIPVFYYYFKTKSDYNKYLQIVNEIKIEQVCESEIKKEKKSIIPKKSEQLLLKKLDKFERSHNYLNPKISLTTLAKQLDTNTKYLSEVVNKNKDKNFNSYINDLRINYILKMLKSETKYRNYKVASLAEECGYLSHSTFIVAFRSVTGITPGLFLNFLNKENNPLE